MGPYSCDDWFTVSQKYINPFADTSWFLRVYNTRLLKKTVGKGEIARNEQFLFFPQCFLPVWINFCHFRQI